MGANINVLHVMPTFYPAIKWGGPIYSVYELCNHLANLPEIVVRVLTTDAAGSARNDRITFDSVPLRYPGGYDVYFCKRILGVSISLSLLWRLPRMVKWADVVHLTGVFSAPTIPTLALCQLLGKPVFWSPRGSFYQWRGARRQRVKRLWNRVCLMLLPKGSAIHCTSDKEASDSKIAMQGVPIRILPNGVEISTPPQKRHRTSEHKDVQIMYMGLISPVKALDQLVQAIGLLGEGYTLDVYGIAASGYEDYAEQVRQTAAKVATSGKIVFHGFVAGDEKKRAFMKADMLVVPSHSENFSNVVAESLAAEVPVIVSRGAPWAEIETHNCGLWVSNDPATLAASIRKMAGMNIRVMGENGRRWIEGRFSWSTIAQQTSEIYSDMKNGNLNLVEAKSGRTNDE